MSSKNYMIDLFSGCGGLSYGFEQAGFECVVGVDQDKAALQTFSHNHQNAKALQLDLSKDESIQEIVEVIGERPIDLIAGGAPMSGLFINWNEKRERLQEHSFSLHV